MRLVMRTVRPPYQIGWFDARSPEMRARRTPVWAHLKRSLANLTKHTIGELTMLVKPRLKRMQ